MPIDLRLDPHEVSLLNDLYEFTVAAAFFERGMNGSASFEVMVRRFPPSRGYMVAAGLDRVIEILEDFHFDAAAIDHLESLHLFKPEFLHHLSQLRFTGSVRAIADGSIFFVGEPVMEVRGPLIEAQILRAVDPQSTRIRVTRRDQGGAMFQRRLGKAAGRVRTAARAGRRRDAHCGAFQLSGGLQRNLKPARGQALRNAGVRHHESQLHYGA